MSRRHERLAYLFAGMTIAYVDTMPDEPTLLDPRTICFGLAAGLWLMSWLTAE